MSFNNSIEGDIINSVRSQQAEFDELSRELEQERRTIAKKIEEVNLISLNTKQIFIIRTFIHFIPLNQTTVETQSIF